MAQAVVLYNFDATGHDELSVSEGEWINLLLSACNEEGWVMGQNSEDKTGLIPSSFVSRMTQEEYQAQLEAAASTMNDFEAATADNNTQEAAWPGAAAPAPPPAADLAIPSCPPPAIDDDEEEDTSSEEETDDSDDGGPPPGLAPPSGPPPPALSPPGPPAQPPSSPMSGDLGMHQAIYDFQASAEDELSIAVGDVVLVKRPGDDEGWFFGSLNGKEGIFPSSYVEPHSVGDISKEATETKKDEVVEDNSSEAASSDDEEEGSSQEKEENQEVEDKILESTPSESDNKCLENTEERKEENNKLELKDTIVEEPKIPPKVAIAADAKVKGKPKEDSSDDSSATETDDSDDDDEGNLR